MSGIQGMTGVYHSNAWRDKFASFTEDATLTINQQVVEVDATGGAATLTLPNVVEAAGRTYYITKLGAGNTFTVTDDSGAIEWNNRVLNGDDDHTVLQSDGRRWWILAETIT